MPWYIHQSILLNFAFLGWKFWKDGRQIQVLAGSELPFIQAPVKEEFFTQLQNLQCYIDVLLLE